MVKSENNLKILFILEFSTKNLKNLKVGMILHKAKNYGHFSEN
jgi:hypothetical protein